MAENEVKRPQFGDRFLTNPEKVFEHNAWDNVEWDEAQETEAKSKVEKNSATRVAEDRKEKFEAEADDYWNKFYAQHQNRFFKDRHWLFTEFPELLGQNVPSSSIPVRVGETAIAHGEALTSETAITGDASSDLDNASTSQREELGTSPSSREVAKSGQHDPDSTRQTAQYPGSASAMRIFEVGCGVGNTVFPVLQTNNDPKLFVYGSDLSSTAVQILKDHADYNPARCHAFVCDVTDPSSQIPFPESSLDIVVLIFVLSAIHPEKMQLTLTRLASYLKPGGLLVFRDYGRYDLAQLRFKDGQCLDDNFYVRGDGTRVYFFTQNELRQLFTAAGLAEEQNIVDRRLQVNRGRQLKMYRVWVQCKYRKPTETS